MIVQINETESIEVRYICGVELVPTRMPGQDVTEEHEDSADNLHGKVEIVMGWAAAFHMNNREVYYSKAFAKQKEVVDWFNKLQGKK